MNHRSLTSRHVINAFAAKARARRTRSQRLADWLTTQSGTISFFVVNMGFFFLWVLVNVGWVPFVPIFDPFPFGLLTTMVSLEAIALAIVVLISQNREGHIATTREEVTLQMDLIAEEELTKALQILSMLAERQGIDLSQDKQLENMVRPTDLEKIEKSIERQIHQT